MHIEEYYCDHKRDRTGNGHFGSFGVPTTSFGWEIRIFFYHALLSGGLNH